MPINPVSRLLAASGCLLILAAAHADPIRLEAAQIKALGIETRVTEGAASTAIATYPARVTVPNAQMRVVAAPVAGVVEMLAVAPGSPVRRGQVLARLASPQALELQRDALQSASQSSLMQQNLKRDEALYAEGLIAESRLQATRAAAAQAAAQASERRQGLALAGGEPGKLGGALALIAPIDGYVLEQGVQLGQRVEAAAPVYRIARLKPLWLEIQVPMTIATGLREGQSTRIADAPVSGKLTAIGRAVDPTSQTVLVRAVIDQGAEMLIPGQAVAVGLDGVSRGGLRVGSAALVRHDGETLVFVQTAGNAERAEFAARKVRVLGQGGNEATVDGLQPGERIVVRGISGLKAMLAGVGKE